jgi:hypothetical protein
MATNYNVTGLADFINADPTKALELVILEGKGTKDYFSIETGVKYQTKIPNITNVDIDISTGSIAGYNTGSGQTTIADVLLSNVQFKVFETYTKEALNKTILASLGRGTDPADLPMEQLILALKSKQLFKQNEKKMWQETVDFSGVVKQVLTDSSTLYQKSGIAAVDFTTITDASILAAVKAVKTKMESALPEFIGNETVLAMSPANFSAWVAAKFNLNGVITTQTIGADGKPVMEAYYPGTNIKVVGLIGLEGNHNLFLTYPENIIQVVDLVGEDESLNFIYNPFARWFELAAQYKLGVKVANPNKVVASAV